MNDKTRFLIKNLSRGLFWLLIILVLFVYISSLVDEEQIEAFLQPIFDRPLLVFLVFIVSEIVFGIIPPEIFMLLSAQANELGFYVLSITMFSTLSYGAGSLGYFIGRIISKREFFKFLSNKYLNKYTHQIKRFGGFLIIVAAVTPLPFSAIAMLMGAIKFPFNKYLLYSVFRFIRFGVYAFIIWNAVHFEKDKGKEKLTSINEERIEALEYDNIVHTNVSDKPQIIFMQF